MDQAVAERRLLTKKQLGARLRELRLAAGLTQEALALKLGMPQNSYSNWERGEASPGLELIDKIAKAIGCDPGQFGKLPSSIPKIKKGRPFNIPSDE